MTIGTKDKSRSNLVPSKSEAQLIRKAFELVELGHDSPSDVLRTLTDMGLRSKNGNKLTLHVFLKTLKNPVYIGQIASKK